jgi:HlyD family secretion protein
MSQKSKKKWIWIGAIVVVLIGVVWFVKGRKKEKVPEITVAPVTRTKLVSKVSSNGQIEAKRKVDLSANVPGQIVNLAVREGDTVQKGDFLLQIDQTQLAATAKGAEASLKALFHDRDAARATAEQARRNYTRAKQSFADELIPQSDLDSAQAAVDSADAQLEAAERRIDQARANLAGARDTLSKTKMIAPMSGTVTRLPVEEGEVAVIGTMNNPGTVLMTISDMSIVEAVMEVDETDIPYVKLGQPAEVTIDAFPDQTFKGLVTEVGSSPIQDLGSQAGVTEAVDFEVKIQVQNPPDGLRPGFSCSADIITGTREDALAAPLQAMVVRDKPTPEKPDENGPALAADRRQEEEGVYLFDEGSSTIKFQPVETGITGETQIEVVKGLKEGDKVVTGPFRTLREIKDGDKVKLEEKKGKNGKGGPPSA